MMGIVGIGIGLDVRGDSRPDRARGARQRDRQRDGLLPGRPLLGFSLGSALTASILASHTPASQHLPDEGGYTLAMWIAVGICIAAAAVAWILPARAARPAPVIEELSEEDAELASAGLVGAPQDALTR